MAMASMVTSRAQSSSRSTVTMPGREPWLTRCARLPKAFAVEALLEKMFTWRQVFTLPAR